MITFKEFLIEDERTTVTPLEAAKFVVENCQQYLKDINFHIVHDYSYAAIKQPSLYRGIGNFSRANGYILSGQRNRNPVDSSKQMTETLDTYFKHRFGFPYRQQGVFCSGSYTFSASYGTVFMIFPTDGYDSIWSDIVEDAYTAFDWSKGGEFPSMARRICVDMEVSNPFLQDIPIEDAWEKWYQILHEWLLRYHPYKDGDILGGMSNTVKPEIMLRCKSYVAIPIENAYYYEFVEEMLELIQDAKT